MYVPRLTGRRPQWLKRLLKDTVEDTYKGDSDAKRVARHLCWATIYKELGGAAEFPRSRCFVLASRLGSDISWLLGAGVAADSIIACDRSAEAAKACAARWPSIRVVTGDAADVVAASEPKRLDVVMLDFCGPLGADNIRTISRVIGLMRYGAVLAIGFMRGREQDTDRGYVTETRRKRRQAASLERRGKTIGGLSAAELVGIDTNMRTGVNKMKAAFPEDPDAVLGGTARLVRLCALVTLQYPHQIALTPLCTFDYQSATRANNGSPMTYIACRKDRPLGITIDPNESRGTIKSGPAKLRELALLLEDEGENAALLLDVPAARVAAWKAHATRGTYAGKERA